MLKDKIISTFQKYPDLKIIFFFDPEGESKEEVMQMEPEDFRIVLYNNDSFNLKIRFRNVWNDEKVFLYIPYPRPEKHEEYLDFPLLDLLVSNKELRLDDVGEFMEEFQLKSHQRFLIQKYIRELKNDNVQKVAAPVLKSSQFEEKPLQRALISSFLKFSKIEPPEILLSKIIILASDQDETELRRFQKKINDNRLMDVLDRWTGDIFSFRLEELSGQRIAHLASIIKYNSIIDGMEPNSKFDPYYPLFINDPFVRNNIEGMVDQARIHPVVRDRFMTSVNSLATQVKEQKIVEIYSCDAPFGWMNPPLIRQLHAELVKEILKGSFAKFSVLDRIESGDEVTSGLKTVNGFLIQAISVMQKIRQIKSFILDKTEQYIEKYRTEWYSVDTAYRNAVSAWKKIDPSELIDQESFEKLKGKIEDIYLEFLERLNREWLKCLAEKNFDYSSLKITKQYDFYQTEIAPFDQKVAVIISDGLRYEVAAELLRELHQDAKNEASIKIALASVPSTTAIGMANLLPGKFKQLEDGKVKIDGMATDGLSNREKILKATEEDSTAILFQQLEGLNQQQAREVFKTKVVYIYHDMIDAIGHKKASERNVLPVIPGLIDELKKLVKYLHSSLNVARVIITADHGFLYNERTIQEKDFEPDFPGDININSQTNRYGLLNNHQKPSSGYCIPFNKVNIIKSEQFILIPPSINRYHRQGATIQYVHGGGCLQEVVVPIIESKRRRTDITTKVNPLLLTRSLKVVSNILRIQLLQENPVSREEKERNIKIGLFYENDLVSNLAGVNMNSTAELPSQRIFSIDLVLLPGEADKTHFSLRVFDQDDPLNRLIETDVINNTLYGTDF